MPYAADGVVSTEQFDGSIEISEEQYREAVDGMCTGLVVSITGGFKVAAPVPSEAGGGGEPDRGLLIIEENFWREDQMALVADQLLRIEDGDPKSLPGTERQWRDYRIQLRAWVDGAEHFPDQAYRPTQPA
jgi:hypothetical protein